MLITKTTSPDWDEPEEDGNLTILLHTHDGDKACSFGRGEPEDFSLARDLNDAYRIVDMLKMAYEAGKRSESFEIKEEKEER